MLQYTHATHRRLPLLSTNTRRLSLSTFVPFIPHTHSHTHAALDVSLAGLESAHLTYGDSFAEREWAAVGGGGVVCSVVHSLQLEV